MDFSPAQEAQDGIAGLLERQTLTHHIAVLFRHPDRVGIAEEIGRVEHHHMQRMALDPFAAIEQPPQRAQLPLDFHAERILDRLHRTHLIGDRADAADSRDDIGQFNVRATLQKRFVEPWRLENAQVRGLHNAALDMQIERAFPFDTGEVIDLDRLSRHAPRSPCGRVRPRH